MYYPCPILGGGIIVMDIANTLKVDGYIQANSKNLNGDRNGGSGGSGGSILIHAGNFTGQLTSLPIFKYISLHILLIGSNCVQLLVGGHTFWSNPFCP